jgi:hypothetical protein
MTAPGLTPVDLDVPHARTGFEAECCICDKGHDPLRICTDCAWCMKWVSMPLPWPDRI